MRILFITSNRIGDAVLSTGILAALIARYPEARVTIACGPLPAPLFTAVPGLDQIIALQKQPYGRHWALLWRRTAGTAWDLVVDLRGSLFAYTVRTGRRRILRPEAGMRHQVHRLADVLGLKPSPAPRIWINPAVAAAAECLVPAGAPVLALAPTANWSGKEWPAERFAEVADALTGPEGILAEGRVLLLGAAAERPRAAALLAALPADRTLDLIGKVDLPTAYASLARAALFIGNDSGLMHLAAASGIPTLGLFGPSREERYAPFGPNGAVVRTSKSYEEIVLASDYDTGSGGSYMISLSVENVLRAAERLWERQRKAA
jgi:ADP-heptose:LPS heptosyltransferase